MTILNAAVKRLITPFKNLAGQTSLTTALTAASLLAAMFFVFLSISLLQIFFGIVILLQLYSAFKKNTFKDMISSPFFYISMLHALWAMVIMTCYRLWPDFDYVTEWLFFTIIIGFVKAVPVKERKALLAFLQKYLLTIFFYGGFIWTVPFLIDYFKFEAQSHGLYGTVFTTGLLMALASFAAVYFFIKKKNITKKILFFAAAVLFVTVTILSHKRSNIAGQFLSLGLFIIVLANYRSTFFNLLCRSKKILMVGFITLIAATALILFKSNTVKQVQNTFTKGTAEYTRLNALSSKRLEKGWAAVNVIYKALQKGDWLQATAGFGFETLDENAAKYAVYKQKNGKDYRQKIHLGSCEAVVPLNELYNWGIPGLLFTLAFYFLCFKLYYQLSRVQNFSLFYILLMNMVIVNLIYRFFTWFHVSKNVFFLVLIALAEEYLRQQKTKANS
ncbi:MAG TPA: hypothetical protein VKS21_04170 [Spirochaetota bacterium]|nr:hypothetical protein [Spirochaetota bacterium]